MIAQAQADYIEVEDLLRGLVDTRIARETQHQLQRRRLPFSLAIAASLMAGLILAPGCAVATPTDCVPQRRGRLICSR